MMKYAVPAFALMALVGCDAPSGLPTGAEVVPFAQVLQETAGRPFECSAYDPVSRTCEGVSQTVQRGDAYISNGRFLINESPRVEFRGTVPFQDVDGRSCARLADLEFEIVGAEFTPFMLELMQAEMEAEAQEVGVLCSTYIRAGSGYIVQTTDAAGQPVEDYDDEVVTFFAERPALRAISFDE